MLCEADSPDSQMSGLFCVTPFRTRGCPLATLVRLSQRILRRKQSAGAGTHKIQRLENRAAYYEKGERRKRVQHIHIKYDGLGFIPLNELMKKETA